MTTSSSFLPLLVVRDYAITAELAVSADLYRLLWCTRYKVSDTIAVAKNSRSGIFIPLVNLCALAEKQ